MSQLFDLSNKTAVVTGASSGLGVQMAKALAGQGANVALLARRKEKLEQVKLEIEQETGVKVLAVECDVANLDQVQRAVEEVKSEFGGVDILLNNAGVGGIGTAEDMTLEDWQLVVDVNLTGVFLCSQQFGKLMIDQKYGKIVNIASIFGFAANLAFPVSAYHATKGAVVNLTRALAAEWAKYGITVNAIGPGFFDSEMTQDIKDNAEADAFIKGGNPMHRWGKPGELNGALLLLASDASSYITGQTIYVDGGWTAV
jgi:NAD(P)-dependent dehydrogenase (short-subunit alcohol dehydrogenase family)